ncbi:MAG: GGDEF domain-containing protein [Chitinispirillia bacterium]|nr:GGDEF domain-containing protein [Chitinispirillia bacterium]
MKQQANNSKRPTIGFFISELENSYTQALCRGITDAAAASNVNVIIFPGKSPKVSYDFQYQYNAIYEIASKNNLDALILATGTMINFLNEEEFKAFYSRYNEIPLVSLSIMLEGISSVLIDNSVGLKDALEHLVTTHKFTNIAWINGPQSNSEAQDRYNVYLDTLKEHNIPFDPELVYEGDFTIYSGVKAIHELLDKRGVKFKALGAANDEMALAAMEELQKRGFKVPEDVAIIGFDNVERSHYCSPSLTTVAQPIYEQAYKAVELACELINGAEPHNVSLPTSLVVRESCGCFSKSVSAIRASGNTNTAAAALDTAKIDSDTAAIRGLFKRAVRMAHTGTLNDDSGFMLIDEFASIINYIIDDKEEKLRDWQNIITESRISADLQKLDIDACIELEDFYHRARMVLLESFFKNDSKRWNAHHNNIRDLRGVLYQLISDVHDREEALRSIIPNLKQMGLNCAYVFLYDRAVEHQINSKWKFPDITLVTAFGDHTPNLSDMVGQKIPVASVLDRSLFPQDIRYTLVISPLFYGSEQIGFIVCEYNFNDIFLFESLIVEISCALKFANLIKTRQGIEDRLRIALEELENYNEHLSNISQTDELTKLLNRRGFMSQSRHAMTNARRMKKDGLLFFADLDGLKPINDTYGHEEGDNAIIVMAQALRKAFRDTDILARLGGDEFTVFTLNTTMEMFETFERRIDDYINDYNRDSGKPYKVGVSIGAVCFDHSDVTDDLEALMNKADIILYQKKKRKKAAIAAAAAQAKR